MAESLASVLFFKAGEERGERERGRGETHGEIQPGRDDVTADPVGRHACGELLHEMRDGRLGRSVGEVSHVHPVVRADGGGGDDLRARKIRVALARLIGRVQQRHECDRCVEHAGNVGVVGGGDGVHVRFPEVGVELVEGERLFGLGVGVLRCRGPGDAGIGDHDVDVGDFGLDLFDALG